MLGRSYRLTKDVRVRYTTANSWFNDANGVTEPKTFADFSGVLDGEYNNVMHSITIVAAGSASGATAGFFHNLSGTLQNLKIVTTCELSNSNSGNLTMGILAATFSGSILNCELDIGGSVISAASSKEQNSVIGSVFGEVDGGYIADSTISVSAPISKSLTSYEHEKLNTKAGGFAGEIKSGGLTIVDSVINMQAGVVISHSGSANESVWRGIWDLLGFTGDPSFDTGTVSAGGFVGSSSGTISITGNSRVAEINLSAGVSVQQTAIKLIDENPIGTIDTTGTTYIGGFAGNVAAESVTMNKVRISAVGSVNSLTGHKNVVVGGFFGNVAGSAEIMNAIWTSGLPTADTGYLGAGSGNPTSPYVLFATDKVTMSNNVWFGMPASAIERFEGDMYGTTENPAKYAAGITNMDLVSTVNRLVVLGSGQYKLTFDADSKFVAVPKSYLHADGDVAPFHGFYATVKVDGCTDVTSAYFDKPVYGTLSGVEDKTSNYWKSQTALRASSNDLKGKKTYMLFLQTTVANGYDMEQIAKDVHDGLSYSWNEITVLNDVTLNSGMMPIGNSSTPFYGTFKGKQQEDGSYPTIRFNDTVMNNKYIDEGGDVYSGIFGVNAGTLSDFNIDFDGTLLAAALNNEDQVNTYYIGVLCGLNQGKISNVSCHLKTGAIIETENVSDDKTIYMGGLIGYSYTNAESINLTNVYVRNEAKMDASRTLLSEGGGAIAYIGGFIGGLATGGKSVKYQSVAVDCQALMTCNTENYYMGGFAGSISVSSGGKLEINTLGVSVSNFSARNQGAFVFNPLSNGELVQSKTRIGTIAGSVDNSGTFSAGTGIWVATETELISHAFDPDFSEEDDAEYPVFRVTGTQRSGGATISDPSANGVFGNKTSFIKIEGAPITVRLYDNGSANKVLRFTKPEIAGFQFAGWFIDPQLSTVSSMSSGAIDGDLVPPINATQYTIYTKMLPQRISTLTELKLFANIVTGGNSFSGVEFRLFDDLTITEDSAFTTIGNVNHYFDGIFDGYDHTITFSGNKALTNLNSYFALFGKLGENGEIHHLNVVYDSVEFSSISTTYSSRIGGLVGINEGTVGSDNYLQPNHVTFKNCTFSIFCEFGGAVVRNGGDNTRALLQNTYVDYDNCKIICENQSNNQNSTENSIYVGGAVARNKGTIDGVIVNAVKTKFKVTSYTSAYVGGAIAHQTNLATAVARDIVVYMDADTIADIKAEGNGSGLDTYYCAAILGLYPQDSTMDRCYFMYDEGTSLEHYDYRTKTTGRLRTDINGFDTNTGNYITTLSGYKISNNKNTYCGTLSVKIIAGIDLRFTAEHNTNIDMVYQPFSQWNQEDDETYMRIDIGTSMNKFVPEDNNAHHGYTILALFVNKSITSVESLNTLSDNINHGFAPKVEYTLESDNLVIKDVFAPIGVSENMPFVGKFNGNGNIITVRLNQEYGFAGLFGYVAQGAEINNFSFELKGNAEYSISGYVDTDNNISFVNPAMIAVYNYGTVRNINVSIEQPIRGQQFASGVVGCNYGLVEYIKVNYSQGIAVNSLSLDSGYSTGDAIAGGIIAINEGVLGTVTALSYYTNTVTIAAAKEFNVRAEYKSTDAHVVAAGSVIGWNKGDVYSVSASTSGRILTKALVKELDEGDNVISVNNAGASGGFVGRMTDGQIVYCESSVNKDAFIYGSSASGGFIGYADKSGVITLTGNGVTSGEIADVADVYDCRVNVYGTIGYYGGNYSENAGGFGGMVYLALNNVETNVQSNNLLGESFVGGFAGSLSGYVANSSINLGGNLNSHAHAGGVVGYNEARIVNFVAYLGDEASNSRYTIDGGDFAGGFAGRNKGSLENVLIQLYMCVHSRKASDIDADYYGSVCGFSSSGLATNVWIVLHNDKTYNVTGNYDVNGGYNSMSIVGGYNLSVKMKTGDTDDQYFVEMSVKTANQNKFYNWYEDISKSRVTNLTANNAVRYTFAPARDKTNLRYHASFYDLDIGDESESTDADCVQLYNEIASASANQNYFTGVRITLQRNITVQDQLMPIGNKELPFNGIFDGNNYTLTLTSESSISSQEYSGLFGCTGERARISNLMVIVEEGAMLAGAYSTAAGVIVGQGGGTFENIVVNTLVAPVATLYKGLFAGKLVEETVTDNCWCVSYNSSLKVVGDGVEVTAISDIAFNQKLITQNSRGVNKLAVIGNAYVVSSLSANSEIGFAVENTTNNNSFDGWYANAVTGLKLSDYAQNNTIGTLVEENLLLFRPAVGQDNLSGVAFTLSFIKLHIETEEDYITFIESINTYPGLSSVTFNFQPDNHELVLENITIMAVGIDHNYQFESVFNGNGNRLVFKNVTINGSFAAMFGYVTGTIKNLNLEVSGVKFGGSTQNVSYSTPLAAYCDGTIENVVVTVGDDNDWGKAKSKTNFAGALGENAQIINSWVVYDEFNTYSAITTGADVAGNGLNYLKLAGEGAIEVAIGYDGAITLTPVQTETAMGSAPYISKNGSAFAPIGNDGAYHPSMNETDTGLIVLVAKLTISDYQELKDFAAIINRGTDYAGVVYELMSDIVIDDDTFKPIGGVYDTRFDGKVSVFSGIFNGNGYRITIAENAAISGLNAGIFGKISDTAVIKNLMVRIDGTIGNEDTAYAGGLVATADCTDGAVAEIKNVFMEISKTATLNADFRSVYCAPSAEFPTETVNVWVIVYNSKQNDAILSGNLDALGVNVVTIIGNGNIRYANMILSIDSVSDTFTSVDLVTDIVPTGWYYGFEYSDGTIDLTDKAINPVSAVDGIIYSNYFTGSDYTAIDGMKGHRLAVSYLQTELRNVQDVIKLAEDVDAYIDFYGISFNMKNDIVISDQSAFKPIGSAAHPFTATFNGEYHTLTLRNVAYSGTYAGLFGYVGQVGSVNNLLVKLDNVSMTADRGGYAGVIAYNEGKVNSMIVEAYGVTLAADGALGAHTYLGAGFGYSQSIDIKNTWVVVDTANFVKAVGEAQSGDVVDNGVNTMIVIGLGTIECGFDEGHNVYFKEVYINSDRSDGDKSWYQDYSEGIYLKNGQGRGTVSVDGQGCIKFVPTFESINMVYECALVYTYINSLTELNELAHDVNAGYRFYNKNYRLGADITIGISNGKYEHTTIGSGSHFYGILEGNGHTITILSSAAAASYRALFDINSGVIRDVNVVLSYNKESYNYGILQYDVGTTGILANVNYGTIENVSLTLEGQVRAQADNANMSLLVGVNGLNGVIVDANVNVYGVVNGAGIGTSIGLVTAVNNGEVRHCTVDICGSISAKGDFGGICAVNNEIVTDCVVTALHMVPRKDAANSTIVIEKQFLGTISAYGYLGMLIGQNNLLARANVVSLDLRGFEPYDYSKTNYVAGTTSTDLANTWAVMLKDEFNNSGIDATVAKKSNVNMLLVNGSGLIGVEIDDESKISFSNISEYVFKEGEPAQKLGKSIYGWFNEDDDRIDANAVYGSVDDNTYIADKNLAGKLIYVEFTNENINTPEDLFGVAKFVNNGRLSLSVVYTLQNSLTITADDLKYFEMIGTVTNPFNCTFDGNGNTITFDTSIGAGNMSDYYGLFGYIGINGTVRNLKVVYNYEMGNAAVDNSSYVDTMTGFVYNNVGNISGCSVEIKSVLYGVKTSGFAGTNGTNGIIDNCTVTVTTPNESPTATLRGLITATGMALINHGTISDSNVNLWGNIEARTTLADSLSASGVVDTNNGTLNNVNINFGSGINGRIIAVNEAESYSSQSPKGANTAYASLYVIKNTGVISNVILDSRTDYGATFNNNTYILFVNALNEYVSVLINTNMGNVKNVVINIPSVLVRHQSTVELDYDPAIANNKGNNVINNVWVITGDDSDTGHVSATKDVNTFYLNNYAKKFSASYEGGVFSTSIAYETSQLSQNKNNKYPVFRLLGLDHVESLSFDQGLSIRSSGDYISVMFTPAANTKGMRVLPTMTDSIACENDWYAFAAYLNVFRMSAQMKVRLVEDITLNGNIVPITVAGNVSTFELNGEDTDLGYAHTITIGDTAAFVNTDGTPADYQALFADINSANGSISKLSIVVNRVISAEKAAALAIKTGVNVQYVTLKLLGADIISTSDTGYNPLVYSVVPGVSINYLAVVVGFESVWSDIHYGEDGLINRIGILNDNLGTNGIYTIVRGDGDVRAVVQSTGVAMYHNTEYLRSVNGYYAGAIKNNDVSGVVYTPAGGETSYAGSDRPVMSNSLLDFMSLVFEVTSTTTVGELDAYKARLQELYAYYDNPDDEDKEIPDFVTIAIYGQANETLVAADTDIILNGEHYYGLYEMPISAGVSVYGIKVIFDDSLYTIDSGNSVAVSNVSYVVYERDRVVNKLIFDLVFGSERYSIIYNEYLSKNGGAPAYGVTNFLLADANDETRYVLEISTSTMTSGKMVFGTLITNIATAEEFVAQIVDIVANGNSLENIEFKLMNDIDLRNVYHTIGDRSTPFKGTLNGDGHSLILDEETLFDNFDGFLKNVTIVAMGSDTDNSVSIIAGVAKPSTNAIVENVKVRFGTAKVGDFIVYYNNNAEGDVAVEYLRNNTTSFAIGGKGEKYEYSYSINKINSIDEFNTLAYLISTYENTTYYDVNIELTCDLDAVTEEGYTLLNELAAYTTSKPRQFSGILDGNGHTIRTSAVNAAGETVYMFGWLTCTLRNLNVVYVTEELPFIRQNASANIENTVHLIYNPDKACAIENAKAATNVNNLIIWYAPDGTVLDAPTIIKGYTNCVNVLPQNNDNNRRLVYTLNINTVRDIEELALLTATMYQNSDAYDGNTSIAIKGDITIDRLSAYAKKVSDYSDAIDHSHAVPANEVIAIFKGFKGEIVGGYHIITIGALDRINGELIEAEAGFGIFDGCANANVKDMVFVYQPDTTIVTVYPTYLFSSAKITDIDNVWMVSYDNYAYIKTNCNNSKVSCVIVNNSDVVSGVTIDHVDGHFVITAAPVAFVKEGRSGLLYNNNGALSTDIVRSTTDSHPDSNFSEKSGRDVYVNVYHLPTTHYSGALSLDYSLYYMLQAYIDNTTFLKGLGLYSPGTAVEINVATDLAGYVINDRYIEIVGNKVRFSFGSVSEGTNKILNVRDIDVRHRHKLYDAAYLDRGYDLSSFMQSIIENSSVYKTEVTFTVDGSNEPVSIAIPESAAVTSVINTYTSGAIDGDNLRYAPRNAGTYIATFRIYKNDVLIGYKTNIIYEISKADLLKDLSVQAKVYDGTISIGTISKKELNLCADDKKGSNYDPTVLSKIKFEYDSPMAGVRYIKVSQGISTDPKAANYSVLAINYQLTTDAEGYLLINGKRVSGVINPCPVSVDVSGDISFIYGAESGTAVLAYNTSGDVATTSEIKVYRKSRVGTKGIESFEKNIADLSRVTVYSKGAEADYYVAIILDDTNETYPIRNVGTYSSTNVFSYLTFVCKSADSDAQSGSNNFVLSCDKLNSKDIVIDRRDIYMVIEPTVYKYKDSFPNVNGNLAMSFRNRYVTFEGRQYADTFSYDIIIENNGEYGVGTYYLDVDAAAFDKNNPNYSLKVKQNDAGNRTRYVYAIAENDSIIDSYIRLDSTAIELPKFRFNSRYYGLAALGKLGTVNSIDSLLREGDSIVYYTEADLDEFGEIDLNKEPRIATDMTIPVRFDDDGNVTSYAIIPKIVRRIGGVLTDMTDNYILTYRDDHAYTINPSIITVNADTLVIVRNGDGTATIRYSLLYYNTRTDVLDADGNKLMFEQVITIGDNESFESADAEYVLMTNSVRNNNFAFGGSSQNHIAPLDVVQKISVRLSELNTVTKTYAETLSAGGDVIWYALNNYIAHLTYADVNNPSAMISANEFEYAISFVASNGVRYTYNTETGKFVPSNGKSAVANLDAGVYALNVTITALDANRNFTVVYDNGGNPLNSNLTTVSLGDGARNVKSVSVELANALTINKRSLVIEIRPDASGKFAASITYGDTLETDKLNDNADIYDGAQYKLGNHVNVNDLPLSSLVTLESDAYNTAGNKHLLRFIRSNDKYVCNNNNYTIEGIYDINGIDVADEKSSVKISVERRRIKITLVDTEYQREQYQKIEQDSSWYKVTGLLPDHKVTKCNFDIEAGEVVGSELKITFNRDLILTPAGTLTSKGYQYLQIKDNYGKGKLVTDNYTIEVDDLDGSVYVFVIGEAIPEEPTPVFDAALTTVIIVLIALVLLMIAVVILYSIRKRKLLALNAAEDASSESNMIADDSTITGLSDVFEQADVSDDATDTDASDEAADSSSDDATDDTDSDASDDATADDVSDQSDDDTTDTDPTEASADASVDSADADSSQTDVDAASDGDVAGDASTADGAGDDLVDFSDM